MDRKENNHKDQSGNGFMLGVVLGSIVTLLFTTKKGREIVKDLTEKGLEKFSELQENIDKKIIIEDVEENDYLSPDERPDDQEEDKPKLLAKEEIKQEKNNTSKHVSTHLKPKSEVKRFFRLKKD